MISWNSGVFFCFPGLTKIGFASSLVGRFTESWDLSGGNEVFEDQEDNMGSLAMPLDVQQPTRTTTRRFTTHNPHLDNHLSKTQKQPWIVFFFSLLLCLL
jgi:hypothetical protein